MRDLCYILFRHWGKGMFSASAVLAVAVWVSLGWGDRYRSEAELLVRMGRESVAIDLVAATGPTIGITQDRAGQVQSGVAILTSEDLLQRLVDEFGPSVFLPRDWSSTRLQPKEGALLAARKSLTVEATPDSAILRVGFEASSPAVAREILGRLIELFLTKHVSIHRTSGAYEFLSEQMTILDDKIAGLRENLAHIRTDAGIYSFDDQRRALAERITELEKEEADLLAANDASTAKSESLRHEISALDRTEIVSETRGDPNPVADDIRTQLVTLRLQEKELLSRLKPESREVRDIRARISLAVQMLEAETADRSRLTRGLNDMRRDLELELLREQAELAGRSKRLAGTQQRLEKTRRRLDFVNSHELSLRGLERELELGEKNRTTYADSLEQARIDRALEEQKISNIRVVQTPSTPLQPVGPGRLWILAVGAILACFMGLGIVFFAEYVDESLRDPDMVESVLQVPVMGSLPRNRFLRKLTGRLARGEDPRTVKGGEHSLALSAAITGRVLSVTERDGPVIIGVVANAPGVGATTVAGCLALNLVSRGKGRVLLVDTTGTTPPHPGGGSQPVPTETMPGPVKGLSLMHVTAVGGATADAEINTHAAEFAYVVVDLAPPQLSEITVDLASACHGVLFVVSPDRSRGFGARRSVNALIGARGEVVGAVVNKRRFPIPGWLYRFL